MGAALDDPAGVQDDDLVDALQAGESVCHEQRGAPGRAGQQVRGQHARRRDVEVLDRFVQEHYRRISGDDGHQRAVGHQGGRHLWMRGRDPLVRPSS
jgi:hypothetical protein